MKILFCLGGLNKGGAERVATNLCNYFVKNGNEVQMVVTRLDDVGYDLDEKIPIKTLEKDKTGGKIIRNIKLLKNLRNFIIEYNPDIVISFLKEPNARMLILKAFSNKIKKIPLIISVRVDPRRLYADRLSKIFVKLFYNKSDGYVFQTYDAQSFFVPNIVKKSTIIPNPIDDKFIQKPVQIRQKKIVTVGRLSKQKNHKLLIDAFKEFNLKYPEYELQIFGDGPLKDEINDYIIEKKLEEKVFLMGTTSDIISNIQNATMFVLSSDYEGMPNALMEALALGIPCISTKSSGGGAEFLIENKKNGLLVEKNDIEALSNAMVTLVEDENLANQMAKASYEKMKTFRMERMNKEWLLYINKVIGVKK